MKVFRLFPVTVICFAATTVYRGDGSGGFYPMPSEQGLAWETSLGPQLADFSGDGIADAVILPYVYAGDGKGGFHLAATLPKPAGNFALSPNVIDLNGDGEPDLVVPDGTNSFSVFLNNNTGALLADRNDIIVRGLDVLIGALGPPAVGRVIRNTQRVSADGRAFGGENEVVPGQIQPNSDGCVSNRNRMTQGCTAPLAANRN